MHRRLRAALSVLAAAAIAPAVMAGGGSAAASPRVGNPIRAALVAASIPTPLLPPAGSVLTGVSSGSASTFQNEVGKHPAIYGEFVTWGQSIHYAFAGAAAAHATLMLHISTTMGYGASQHITPLAIAQGGGDAYLLSLSALIAHYARPVYIRLMPEMDQANNAYCGFNADGSSRGPQYAPSGFVAAWRRAVIVLRGGSVAAIDARLAALGEPALHGRPAGASLPVTPIAFVWTPQVAGSPDIPANSPAAYFPGNAYVDWIGTDFYSKFPNFAGLTAFYKEFPGKPFAFGEWAIWGGDDPGFVDQLFSWVDAHPRVQMMVYNQGYITNGPFRLNLDPASTAAIHQRLAGTRFLADDPGT